MRESKEERKEREGREERKEGKGRKRGKGEYLTEMQCVVVCLCFSCESNCIVYPIDSILASMIASLRSREVAAADVIKHHLV